MKKKRTRRPAKRTPRQKIDAQTRARASARMERAHEPLDGQAERVNVGRPSPRSVPPEPPPGGFPTLAERNRQTLEGQAPRPQSRDELARAHAAAVSTDLHAPQRYPTLAERVAREGVKRQLARGEERGTRDRDNGESRDQAVADLAKADRDSQASKKSKK